MEDAPRWVYTDKQLPSIHGAMTAVATEIKARADALGLDRSALELVNLRCSQINGCAFCLHLHTHLALRGGESPQRIAVLSAWRESGLFTRVEQAALTIADAVTMVSERHLSGDEYDLLREDLTDDQLALLVYAASMINAFNRVSILSHHPVTYWESFGTPGKGGTHGSQETHRSSRRDRRPRAVGPLRPQRAGHGGGLPHESSAVGRPEGCGHARPRRTAACRRGALPVRSLADPRA